MHACMEGKEDRMHRAPTYSLPGVTQQHEFKEQVQAVREAEEEEKESARA